MKQEMINAFLVKNANKLTLDQRIELQRQLSTCDDKAFAILMSHNKPIPTPAGNLRALLLILSIAAPIASLAFLIVYLCSGNSDFIGGVIMSCMVLFSSICILQVGPKKGRSLFIIGSRKTRLYENYLKIIQENK